MKQGLRAIPAELEPFREKPEYDAARQAVSTDRSRYLLQFRDPLAWEFTKRELPNRLSFLDDYGYDRQVQNNLDLLLSGGHVAGRLIEYAERQVFPYALLMWQMFIDLKALPDPTLEPQLQLWVNALLIEQPHQVRS